MDTVGRTYLVCALFLTTVHRLPAPIQEVPDTPTPTPAPTSQSQPSSLPSDVPGRPDPARFAGTWTGKIKIGKGADVDITLVVNPEANSLTQKSTRLGERVHETSHPTAISGDTLSWQGGQTNNIAWRLTPNPDGQTALATTKGATGVENTAIFQRVQPASSPARKHPGAKVKQNSGN
jgi:hypothetical protein